MSKFISGVHKSPDDRRDYIYSSVKPIKTELPSKYILEEWEVNNQKQYGSCLGQAGSGIKDWQESKEWNEVIDTSPLFIYSKCKELDGLNQPGTYPRITMKVLKNYGTVLEKDFPYYLLKDDINPIKPSKELEEKAKKYRVKSYARLYTVEEIKQALVQENGPVLLALMWVTNMSYPENGFMPIPNGRLVGGHGLCITGFNDSLKHTYRNGKTYKGFFRLRNSWGSNWGDNGYCWMPYEMINTDIFMESWCCIDEIINPPKPDNDKNDNDNQDDNNKKETKIMKMNIPMQVIPPGHTVLPFRSIYESLGAKVEWHRNADGKIVAKATIPPIDKETVIETVQDSDELKITR